MIRLGDQLNRTIELQAPARRIVSLVPSQTELLHALGLEEEVVGITRFCIHPADWRTRKTVVGGTKDFKTEVIRNLHPDLIIANREENDRQRLEELASAFPVWVSDIKTLEDALDMISSVGQLSGKTLAADQLNTTIQQNFRSLVPGTKNKKVLYLIWKKPWMCAGTDTFINDMLERCGYRNVVGDLRYPELSEDELRGLQPDLVLLSSEPFPFREKHIQELEEILPSAKIKLVDGELFSWYGSRIAAAPSYFQTLIAST